MSDIDDELLALAGGDVSSDEEETRDGGREATPSESPEPTATKETPASKGVAAKKTAAKRTPRGRDEDDSAEEGEASSVPGSPDSQQSAPMDESNSDSDSPPSKPRAAAGAGDDEDVVKYPVEGLFIDLAEREQIMSMREIEREQILAERREENERIRQNRMLRQLVVNQDKDNKKRKASAAELEDSNQRKTSRVRTKVGGTKVGETSSGMDSLRRAREERNNRMQQRERENDRRHKDRESPSRRRSLDRDGGGDSDVEWAGPAKRRSGSPEARESAAPELRDFERIRVGRSRFAEVCYYPNFEEAITGCYVRINIGPDPTTRQDVYRMAVIKGFTKGRPYAVSDYRGHQIVVETYVKAAHGKALREWPFIMCSDRGFTEAEWSRYKKVCTAEGVNLPKKPALVNKIDDINKLVNRRWTEVELADKLNRQNSLRIKYSGVERDRLAKQVTEARARGDEERAAKLQEQLDNLEVPRLAFKTSLKSSTSSPSGKRDGASNAHKAQQERLAQVNAENRRRNTKAVREAQRAEILKSRDIEARIERGEHVEEDHSRRVKTRMKFLHDAHEFDDLRRKKEADALNGGGGGKTTGSGASTPGGANGTPNAKAALPLHIAKLQEQQRSAAQNGIPVIHKPLMDDDIIGALDLDIDVEIN